MKKVLCGLVFVAACSGVLAAAATPKRLLVVTGSTGFRHSSIEVTEKALREMAQRSGDFVVISMMDHPDYPEKYSGFAYRMV